MRYYKVLSGGTWDQLPGKLAGSEQPGCNALDIYDASLLSILEDGRSLKKNEIDRHLIKDLQHLHDNGVRVIYNLVAPPGIRDPKLIKYVWENMFEGTQYIMEINGVNIGVEDFDSPTPQQFELITNDALERLQKGENILVHCRGGMGRTGTILCAIYMKASQQYDVSESVKYIRNNYARHAVESTTQEEGLEEFAQSQIDPQRRLLIEAIPTNAAGASAAPSTSAHKIGPLAKQSLVAFTEVALEKMKSSLAASLEVSENKGKKK